MGVFLCGNTGIENRGCEAIIRSTVSLLDCFPGSITLASFNTASDTALSKELGINIVGYNQYPNRLYRLFCGTVKKVFKKSLCGLNLVEKPLFSLLQSEDLCLNIGGDTYCYNRPVVSYALNRFTSRKSIRNVLWCCSIGKENLDEEKVKDLRRYTKIFARESLTYNVLLEAGIPKDSLVKCCDPAFFLKAKETDLPSGFEANNTIGINMSHIVIGHNDQIQYRNVVNLIKYILDNTGYRICLIPHVYNVEKKTNDYELLLELFERFASDRISVVNRELSCEELKYIISKCVAFVGARTHATIAAYSSYVPTLVVGYSVKSKGIATDLFGSYDGYVLPFQEMKEENELTSAFIGLMNRKDDIVKILKNRIPIIKDSLTEAIRKYITPQLESKPLACPVYLCTGCGACSSACRFNALKMYKNDRGFLFPKIDGDKCVSCGQCNTVCPVINRKGDSGKSPEVIIAENFDQGVLKKSSSGGVFFELAKTIIMQGGFVAGAVFDFSEKRVKHILTDELEELTKIMGSKYVQSSLGSIFSMIREKLTTGVPVLFSGTPCQVEGLKNYLQKEYDNLFCVDFICHGVPSPLVFKKYLEDIEKKHNHRIVGMSMRSKRINWREYGTLFVFDDHSELFEPAKQNDYMIGYINNIYTRDSCRKCGFRKINRVSDVTLGDAWGIGDPDDAIQGLSSVIIHSEKGKSLFNRCRERFVISDGSLDLILKNNASYYRDFRRSPLTDCFYRGLEKHSFSTVAKKYFGSGYLSKTRRMVLRIIKSLF